MALNLWRLKWSAFIIPVSSRKLAGSPDETIKKAKELARSVRQRAINGEDMTVVQGDAYKALGLPAPPNTDMGTRRRGSFPPALEAQLFALKAGEVTKIETEPARIHRLPLTLRGIPVLDQLRPEILRDLHEKNVEKTIKAVMDDVHTNLNLDFFTPAPVASFRLPT